MGSGGRQRVELAPPPPEPIRSRPLATGKQFLLVIGEQRIVAHGWDKALYADGEKCTLTVIGKHLGKQDLELAIEVEDRESGSWVPLTTVQAKINGDQSEAKADWKFPPLADPNLALGHLKKACWDKDACAPGDSLKMTVEAEGLEDAWIAWIVERETADGEWESVTRWDSTIKSGKCETRYVVPKDEGPSDGAEGALVEACFEDEGKLSVGETAWLLARTSGLTGAQLDFVLEYEEAPGKWVTAAEAVASVKDGRARAGLKLEHKDAPLESEPAVLSAAFEGKTELGELATMVANTTAMDGQSLTFVLEAEVDEGQWQEVAAAVAAVDANQAQVRLKLDLDPLRGVSDQPMLLAATLRESAPGELEASVEAHLLDGQSVTVVLEKEGDAGWTQVATEAIEVREGRASKRFAVDPGVELPEVGGFLTKAELREVEGGPGQGRQLELVATAHGLDGATLGFVLEQETATGWEQVATDEQTVRDGRATSTAAVALLPPLDELSPGLLAARFERRPEGGLVLAATAHDLDGQRATFVLQQTDGEVWTNLAEVDATFRDGKAVAELPKLSRARLVVPAGAGAGGAEAAQGAGDGSGAKSKTEA